MEIEKPLVLWNGSELIQWLRRCYYRNNAIFIHKVLIKHYSFHLVFGICTMVVVCCYPTQYTFTSEDRRLRVSKACELNWWPTNDWRMLVISTGSIAESNRVLIGTYF